MCIKSQVMTDPDKTVCNDGLLCAKGNGRSGGTLGTPPLQRFSPSQPQPASASATSASATIFFFPITSPVMQKRI